MPRVRISTTVDQHRLEACRRLFEAPDSRLIDRALQALLDELEARAELRALDAHPYDEDPELSWEVSEGPALPYDGKVPQAVLAGARARRRRR